MLDTLSSRLQDVFRSLSGQSRLNEASVDAALRELMDIKIFVDTADDLRFIRRLQRDVHERGRTVESVIKQYLDTVRPMHEQFVEPSKRHADVIIPEGGYNEVGIDLISGKIRAQLQKELSNKHL